jgi:hypothetical protein
MARLTGIDWMSKLPISGTHTAVSADDSANKVEFNTGQPTTTGFMVQIFRSGVNIGNDVKASLTSGVLTIEDGSTYKITAGDVINWMVF